MIRRQRKKSENKTKNKENKPPQPEYCKCVGKQSDEAAAAAVALLLDSARLLNATLVIATHDQRIATLIASTASATPGYTAVRLTRPTPVADTPTSA